MKKRKALDKQAVIDTATALVEAEGASALTLSRVARELGIKTPSLYNHVAGLEPLRRDVAMRAAEDLGRRLGSAAMGRAGRSALVAIGAEFRAFATAHPGLYELSTQARPEDQEFSDVMLQSIEPVVAVLRGFDLEGDEAIHAARTLRAALHGFVSLEHTGGFGLEVDVDESFEWLVERLADTFDPSIVRR